MRRLVAVPAVRRHLLFVVDAAPVILEFFVVPHFGKSFVAVEAEKFIGRRHARANVAVRANKHIAPADVTRFVRFIASRVFTWQMRQFNLHIKRIAGLDGLLKNFRDFR